MKKIWIVSILIFILTSYADASIVIKYYQNDIRYHYRIELLKSILNKSSPGKYKLAPYSKEQMTNQRGLNLLEEGAVSVASLGYSRDRGRRFLAIKNPILKKLLSYRIFLANKKFKIKSKISNFEDLFPYKMGFGKHWADIDKLKTHGLQVEGITNYESIFKMLNKGRFVLFPRGVNEVYTEFEKYKDKYPNIYIEKNLALFYHFPVYFFVNKKNIVLAGEIERGLKMMKKDGSFETLFSKYHDKLLKKAKLNTRKIFELR